MRKIKLTKLEHEVLSVAIKMGSAIPTGAERVADYSYRNAVKKLISKGFLNAHPPHNLISLSERPAFSFPE